METNESKNILITQDIKDYINKTIDAKLYECAEQLYKQTQNLLEPHAIGRLKPEHVKGIEEYMMSLKNDPVTLLNMRDAFVDFINTCVAQAQNSLDN